jgi:hypothetical protein
MTHATFTFFPLLLLIILHSEFHSSFLSHLVFLCSVCQLLVAASVVPSSPILVTLMKEALGSSETSVLTRVTRHSEFHSSFLSHLVLLRSVRWLIVAASVVPSSPILVTLMKEALDSSETFCSYKSHAV